MSLRLLIAILFCAPQMFAGTFSTIHPAAVAWRSNTVSQQSSSANYPGHFYGVNQIALRLSYAGIYQKCYYINPVAGDDYKAALCTLKHPTTGTPDVNTSFVSGDYTPGGGLTGDGSTKTVNTGLNPRTHIASTNSFSVWADVFTQGGSGSSSIFACGDANTAVALGWYSSGTMETCQMGSKQGNSGEYPNASTTRLTGFLGGNVKSLPISINQTIGSSVSSEAGLQGIAYDGANFYFSDNLLLASRTAAGTWLATNSATPFTNTAVSLSIPGANHFGGMGVTGGKLYVGIVAGYASGDTLLSCSNQCIGVYGSTSLMLSNIFWVTNEMPEISACEVDPANNRILAISYYSGSNIWFYALDTGAYQGKMQIVPPIPRAQGITITNGLALISSSVADPTNTVYAVDLTTGESDPVLFTIAPNVSETEDLCIVGTDVAMITRSSGNYKTVRWPITMASTAGWRGVRYWKDGLARDAVAGAGLPTITTGGLPSQNMLGLASNGSGTPGSWSSRRVGLRVVGQGLTALEILQLHQAVYALDKTLGRR